MLLRRITEHVKAQNWTAIVIDFVIVVVGVFIGIQVANWNDARVQNSRDTILLNRLYADFSRIVDWGDRMMPRIEAQSVQTKRMIDTIRADKRPDMDDDFRDMASATVAVLAGSELSPTYEELVATGTLSRIKSAELRAALSRYSRRRESAYILLNQQLRVRDTGAMDRAIRFQASDDDYEATKNAESFDWEALKATEPHLQVVLRNQVLRADWQRATYESAQSVLRLLEEQGAALPESAVITP